MNDISDKVANVLAGYMSNPEKLARAIQDEALDAFSDLMQKSYFSLYGHDIYLNVGEFCDMSFSTTLGELVEAFIWRIEDDCGLDEHDQEVDELIISLQKSIDILNRYKAGTYVPETIKASVKIEIDHESA